MNNTNEGRIETLTWEIEETLDCVDTDTFEGICIAEDGSDTYTANCTINRGSGDVAGTIIEIDYSTVERKA